jgi:hypothetical protein
MMCSLSRRRISLWKLEVTSSSGKYLEDRLTELEVENSRLQRLVVELLLKNQQLRDTRLSESDNGHLMGPGAGRPLIDTLLFI